VRPAARRSGLPATALLIIALLSAVLLGSVQDASCAMHGLGAVRTDASRAIAMSAHHDAHAPRMSHEGGQHSHRDGGCDCTCIGACTMAAPIATAPAAVTLRVGLVAPEPRVPLDREPARTPPVAPDRLLPFGNGPPASPLV
jgi:hypothetical protein